MGDLKRFIFEEEEATEELSLTDWFVRLCCMEELRAGAITLVGSFFIDFVRRPMPDICDWRYSSRALTSASFFRTSLKWKFLS